MPTPAEQQTPNLDNPSSSVDEPPLPTLEELQQHSTSHGTQPPPAAEQQPPPPAGM